MDLLVTIQTEYEDPKRPGLWLNHFVQFVDQAPDFPESQDLYSSFSGITLRFLRVLHQELPAEPLPEVTHFPQRMRMN